MAAELLVDNPKRIRSVWAHPRTEETWIWYRDQAPEKEFKDAFRMSRSSFWKLIRVRLLCEDLQARLNTQAHAAHALAVGDRLPVSPEKQVALTLYKTASCAESRIVADVFGVHKSTVCRYFHRVVKCITRKLMGSFIQLPVWILRKFRRIFGAPKSWPKFWDNLNSSRIERAFQIELT
ncbi:protein ANTAGONIST OF LIKE HETEROCHROMATIN PROTEIN 1 [Sergentomyia squamirostris]